MAAAGGRDARGRGTGRSRPSGGGRSARTQSAKRAKGAGAKSKSAKTPRPQPAADAALPDGPFRLGAIEGATPGKWIDVWKQRMPRIPLELVPLGIADQRAALTGAPGASAGATVDAAIVRLPIDRTGLHAIGLYDEVPVVVCAADSHLTAAEELTVADLAGEVLIVPQDAPLDIEVPDTLPPRFTAPATVGEAIAVAASGVGIVVVPMSLARLHHRKDAAHRPLVDGPLSSVALAWPVRPDGEENPLVEAFIGIVRGRTANSSR